MMGTQMSRAMLVITLLMGTFQQVTQAQSLNGVVIEVQEVILEEAEPGIEPYLTRMLLWGKRLRIDNDGGADGYLLFDAELNRILSVANGDQSIVKIQPHEWMRQLEVSKLVVDRKQLQMKDAPKVANITPTLNQLVIEDRSCQTTVSVDGFLPEFIPVMQQYKRLLALDGYQRLDQVPEEFQIDCYLSNFIYFSDEAWKYGFPINQKTSGGVTKRLVSFGHKLVSALLFDIPAEYRVYEPGS
jgi:hypothetical protein